MPVADVRVEFVEYPVLAVITDAEGDFVLRETKKPELFVPIGETDAYNIGSRVAPRLRISREGYETLEIDASRPEFLEQEPSDGQRSAYQVSKGPFHLRPITLTPAAR